MKNERRQFLKTSGLTALGVGLFGLNACTSPSGENSKSTEESGSTATTPASNTASNLLFNISLAQWSLHKSLQGGLMDHLDFAARAKNEFGVDAVEYVNQFFATRARDKPYIREMKKRADDNGVKSLLIMVDHEGPLAEPNNDQRQEAIENHYKWVEAAEMLGCHSIRVNLAGTGSAEDMANAALDGLASLSDFAKDYNINVIVENHGGNSSNGQWLSSIIQRVRMNNCGTLPDFGNFCLKKSKDASGIEKCVEEYDRYQGIQELLPFAKAVSAKAYDFDEAGNETLIDFKRVMKMVIDSGYKGYVGIEYEGDRLSEEEGIKATIRLLERVRTELS